MTFIRGLCQSLAAGHSMSMPAVGHLYQLCRQLSSVPASVTDQMIQYAMSHAKGQHDQAIDVLKSGLSMHPEGGLDAAKLLVAQGQLESDRHRWAAVLECSKAAQDALRRAPSQPEAAPAVNLVHVQAARLASTSLLIQSRDQEAESVVNACGETLASSSSPAGPGPNPAHLAYLSLSLTTAHALGQAVGSNITAGRLSGALSHVTAGSTGVPPDIQAQALVDLGNWQAAQGSVASRTTAGSLYQQAAQLIAPSASSGGVATGELHAAALLGSAQLSVFDEQWDTAEEVLGKALSAAEGVSSDKHARVAPILTLLGHVYSRSARVTFAEGLYRECAKILQVDPMLHPASANLKLPTSVHPSLVAVLAWRFHQLLSVMPNRGRESSAWEGMAAVAWSHAGAACQPCSIAEVLGTSDLLTGKGSPGRGVLLSVTARRALPVFNSTA